MGDDHRKTGRADQEALAPPLRTAKRAALCGLGLAVVLLGFMVADGLFRGGEQRRYTWENAVGSLGLDTPSLAPSGTPLRQPSLWPAFVPPWIDPRLREPSPRAKDESLTRACR